MRKIIALLGLAALISASVEAQNKVRATIKPGTTPNSVDIYFKPDYDNNKAYFDNLSITVAVRTQTPSATATMITRNINSIPWDNSLAGTGGTEAGVPYGGFTFYTFLSDPLGPGGISSSPVTLENGTEILAATVTFTGSAALTEVYLVSLDKINGGSSLQRYTYLQMSGSPAFNPGPFGPIGQVSPDPSTGGALFYSIPTVSAAGQFESGSPYVRTVADISLPVKLKSFSGTQDNCVGKLDWLTAEEVNFSHFEVEQSSDGATYTKAGTVQAAGGTAAHAYKFSTGTLDGRKYYRLKMVDNDGKFTYSNVVLLTANCGGSVYGAMVYPNPAGKGTDVNINLHGFTGSISGKLFDTQGRMVSTQQLKNGTNVLNTTRLSAGMYHLALQDAAGNAENKKIVITQ
ncbi:MAG: T9SS type A sorting domain-containing protein [Bacteroidetes bacterium]|nr:T9SS type A sorting domain-containing protein [Bacteroidota bacterium]